MKKTHRWLSAFVSVALAFAVAGCQIDSDRHEHSFSKDWTSNATDHWHAATCGHTKEVSDKTAHTFGEWNTTVEATEETEGKKERICSVCLYKEEQSLAKLDHTHKFSSDWTSDAIDHWHAATCGHTKEVSDKAKHIFGDWTVTKEATEEAEGSKERSCSVCGYTATEASEKLAHTHKFAEEWTKDETNHWHAATCGHTTEVSGKAEHSFGDWTVTKEATCTENGERKTTCTICGYEKTEVSGKAEHTFGDYVSNNDATTEADGTKTRECSVCGYKDTVTDEGSKIHVHTFAEEWTSDASGHWHAAACGHTDEKSGFAEHTFGEYVSNNDATTETDGTKTRECSVCGYKDTVTDEGSKIHVHTFEEEWSSDETNHWHASTCGHTTEISGKAEHSFGDWIVTKAATEEAEGSRERTCTVCGYTATEAIEKLAHTHKFAKEWTKDGTYHWHAATCEHTEEVSDKAAHSFGDWTVTKAATCTEKGEKKTTCTTCGYEETEITDKAEHTYTNGVCNCGLPEGFVLIPAGTFQMGSNAGEDRNKPVHEVTITKSFYMGKYEVTQAEYEKYCWYGGISPSSSYGDGDNYPAYYVSWYDALVYCNKRSMAEGLTPCYSISGNTDPSKWGTVPTSTDSTWNAVVCNWNANGYRLPTEAEWEYAARAGDNTVGLIYSGTSDVNKLGEYAWYAINSNSKTHRVGTKSPNAFGLYDMSGNVCEWCWNRSTNSYDAETEGGSDPTGASSGGGRVARGGGWNFFSDRFSVSFRGSDYPSFCSNYVGFRVVRASSK